MKVISIYIKIYKFDINFVVNAHLYSSEKSQKQIKSIGRLQQLNTANKKENHSK